MLTRQGSGLQLHRALSAPQPQGSPGRKERDGLAPDSWPDLGAVRAQRARLLRLATRDSTGAFQEVLQRTELDAGTEPAFPAAGTAPPSTAARQLLEAHPEGAGGGGPSRRKEARVGRENWAQPGKEAPAWGGGGGCLPREKSEGTGHGARGSRETDGGPRSAGKGRRSRRAGGGETMARA